MIRSEIRPIFAYHRIDDGFLGGGDAQLYAVQIRYALTDRLALIATQDGYFSVNNDAIGNPDGWTMWTSASPTRRRSSPPRASRTTASPLT